jgi:hypothetical protein
MAPPAQLTCDEFADLAAAVALNATDALEESTRMLEHHAGGCRDCARQLDEFRSVAAALGSAVEQVDPPAGLRGRVLFAARQTHQPVVRSPRRLVRQAWRQIRFSPAWLAAAASLVISTAAIVRVAQLQGEIEVIQHDVVTARERAARYERVVGVLASDKLAIRPLRPVVQDANSRGMVYMDPSSGQGMLMCRNLPPVEQGRAYQIWFVRGNERVSGGLLLPDLHGNGNALIRVPNDVMSFESIGLTDEPSTGSAWPTTPRIIGTPLKEVN